MPPISFASYLMGVDGWWYGRFYHRDDTGRRKVHTKRSPYRAHPDTHRRAALWAAEWREQKNIGPFTRRRQTRSRRRP